MQLHENDLKKVLARVFGISEEAITEDASPDSIDEWDSLRHMNLVIALEESFNIELTDDQVGEILTYKLIKMVLVENGIKFA